MNINELPTLTYHFFEAPNKLTITNNDFSIMIQTNFDCDSNFVLDAKSFDMLKKLGGPIKVNANKIEFNKYKCSNIDVAKPNLYLDNVIYTHEYDATLLKEATKFVGNNISNALQGVLFNDNGDVFATDSFKFYFMRKIAPYTRFWSVPVNFIRLLPDGVVKLNFTESKIFYEGEEYNLYNSLYTNVVPAIEKICDNFKTQYIATIENKPELTYLPCEIITINANENNITFLFDDNEKQFKVEYENNCDANFNIKIRYEHFMQALQVCNNNIKIEFGTNMLKIDDKIIICYMR